MLISGDNVFKFNAKNITSLVFLYKTNINYKVLSKEKTVVKKICIKIFPLSCFFL